VKKPTRFKVFSVNRNEFLRVKLLEDTVYGLGDDCNRKDAGMVTNADKNIKVLVVEDDPAYRRLLELYIHRAGCEVDSSSDGKTALDMVSDNDYHLILIDMQIPKIDGIMFAFLLREKGYRKPLIAITALKVENMEQNALTVGFDEFLEKPVEYCLLYTSPSPRDRQKSRMPSSA
jgi:CheY-like chemotaxis protein